MTYNAKKLSDELSVIMDNVDKSSIILSLLDDKFKDNHWQITQTLAVVQDILKPMVNQLIDMIETLDDQVIADSKQKAS